MVERGRERPETVGRDAAEGRLEAGHAAGRGRQPDRGARVGPEPERAQACRERARIAARGAARDAIGARAVDDGAVGAVARGHAPGELVQVGLAEHDRAGVDQAAHARGRAHRDVVAEDPRAVGRAHARRVEDVLDEQRHAGERPGRLLPRARECASPVTVMTACRCSCSAMRSRWWRVTSSAESSPAATAAAMRRAGQVWRSLIRPPRCARPAHAPARATAGASAPPGRRRARAAPGRRRRARARAPPRTRSVRSTRSP